MGLIFPKMFQCLTRREKYIKKNLFAKKKRNDDEPDMMKKFSFKLKSIYIIIVRSKRKKTYEIAEITHTKRL